MRILLLLFVVVPLVELYLLIWLSGIIGFWATVAITMVTGIIGGTLAKREGLRVWREWNAAISQLRPPSEGVIDGVLVFVGGAFLITPGVLTDALGLILLLRPTRRAVASRIRQRVDAQIATGQLRVEQIRVGGPAAGRQSPRTIDTTGESVRES